MKVVVGLGNYGDKYAYTFHNMGFLAAEALADKLNMKFKDKECDSSVAVGYRGGEKIIVARPLTYMNLSGKAVKQLVRKYNLNTATDLIVVYDDIDLPKGTVRVRPKGSAGTHNGMRNIIAEIGTEQFHRIRIGIGPVPENVPLVDYVLADVPKSERETIFEAFCRAADEAIRLIDAK